MATPAHTFRIGATRVYGDLILAPMDGFSDLPFRSLCREFGSAVSYTAFVNAIDLLQDLPSAWRDLAYKEQERPVVFQIFDNDEQRLLDAALAIQPLQPDAIDINMGCSVRRVSGRGAGAGLLRDPAKIERILTRLVKEVDLPVTAKIRLGWDDAERNYMQVARAIEQSGAALLAVHGRTRQQGYRGDADWDAIAEIKSGLVIPVIGNGDVRGVADISRIQVHTACDGVMIGRAAMGNPWIFRRQEKDSVSIDELSHTIQVHLSRMLEHYGTRDGLIRFRKHLKRYLAPLRLDHEDQTAILRCKNLGSLLERLANHGLEILVPERLDTLPASSAVTLSAPMGGM